MEFESSEQVMKQLLENQKILIEQNRKIIEAQNAEKDAPRARRNEKSEVVSLALKRNVRIAVKNKEEKWDFKQSFRSPANEDVNKLVLRDLKCLQEHSNHPDRLIEKAMKAHLNTKRREQTAINNGEHKKIKQRERRRHRINMKLKNRREMAEKSTAYTERDKRFIKTGLVFQAMSPEVSEEESNSENSESDDEDHRRSDDHRRNKRRRIVRQPLSWRSKYFCSILESLDRKWVRRSSDKSRAMCQKRCTGPVLKEQVPQGMPDWTVEGRVPEGCRFVADVRPEV